MEEISVVTPPGVDRTARMAWNRVYKAFPRQQYEEEDVMDDGKVESSIDPSTPAAAATRQSKNDSPATAASTASEADEDGIYGPPSLRPRSHRVEVNVVSTATTATRSSSRNPLLEDVSSVTQPSSTPPRDVSFEAEDRTAVDDDLPFDQINESSTVRDTSNASTTLAATRAPTAPNPSYSSSNAFSPLRNPQLSDFDDSHLSPVSTRFESIWISTPEASPDRETMVSKARAIVQERNPTATTSQQQQRFTKKHMAKMDELDKRMGRFTVPTPRYSDPQPWSGPLSPPSPYRPSSVSSSAITKPVNIVRPLPTSTTNQAMHTSPLDQYEKDMSSPAIRHTRYELQDQSVPEHQQSRPTVTRGNEHGPSNPNVSQRVAPNARSKDEDTLFDFEGNEQTETVDLDDDLGKNLKVTHKVRQRRTRQRREKVVSETDDDTSVENYGAPIPATSLQERTHQAWKSRQKKNSSFRSAKSDQSQPPRAVNQSVSFGKPNTVHHFQPTAQEEYDRQRLEEEDASLDRSMDRSLNSEYTKTLESEVEDMIKDILFIGNSKKSKPGRRKFKDKPEVRRRMRQSAMAAEAAAQDNTQTDVVYKNNEETLEDMLGDSSTLPSIDQPSSPVVDRSSASTRDIKAKHAVEAALNDSVFSNESLLSSQMSSRTPTRSTIVSDDRTSVLSASSADSQTIESLRTNESFRSEKQGNDDPFAAVVGLVEGGLTAMSSVIGYAFGESEEPSQQTRGRTKTRDGELPNKPKRVEKQSNDFNIFESCMGSAVQLLEGPEPESTTKGVSKGVVDKLAQDLWYNPIMAKSISATSPSFHDEGQGGNERIDPQLLKLSNGSKVSMLALHAAHSVHKLQGVEYDESVPIDMGKELKVCSVTLILPLGIIFLENDGGCFVTKVSPDGSAARSGRVEVGDQLACINGASSLHMKVDDICDVIANSFDPQQVELVFLRYIGPFRAAEKTLLESKNKFRLDSNGSFDDSLAKKSKSPWRMNPMRSNKKEPAKPNKLVQGEKDASKKKSGFRLFGRGKKSNNNE